MKSKLPVYQLLPCDEDDLMVALVDSPAIEQPFLAFKDEEPKKYYFADEEQKMLYGAVLIPDLLIYRNSEGYEYQVYMNADTIKKISQKFMQDNKRFNLEHQFSTDGVEVVESWIKADPTYDKSIVLGLSQTLPVGTWFIGAKVNNEEVWKLVKEGEFHGFSIEATFNAVEEK